MYTFEVLPQSWSKRRAMDKPSRELVSFKLINFEKVDSHRCLMEVKFDDEEVVELDARVYVNRTHVIQDDGSLVAVDNSWGVQAISPSGHNIVLRLVENECAN